MKKIFTLSAIFAMLFSASMVAQDFPGDPGTLIVDLETVAADQATGDSIPMQAPTGAGAYEKGQTAIVTAREIEGYTFQQWDDQTTENPRTVTMNESQSLTAFYSHDEYTITFQDADGMIIKEARGYFGDTIRITTDEIPVHEATEQYSYQFTGWSPAIGADNVVRITGSQIYFAQYDTITNKYSVIFKDWDGEWLQLDTLEYGAEVKYNGSTPTRNTVDGVKYTFKGWTPELIEGETFVRSNMEFTAEYDEEEIEFTVTVILTGGEGDTLTQTFGANYGGEVTIQLDIPADYHFLSWEGGNTEYPLTITVFSDTTFNGTIGSSFVDINVTANQWNFICLPQTNEGIQWNQDVMNTEELGTVSWATYNGETRAAAQSGWENVEMFESMKGYILYPTETGRLRLGVWPENLAQGVLTFPLYAYESEHQQNAGWNFLGNPYNTEFAAWRISAGDAVTTLTVWNGTGYDNELLSNEDFVLSPLQAFFIQTSGEGTISFNEDNSGSQDPGGDPSAPAPQRSKTAAKSRIDIEATAGGYTDKTRVIFDANSSLKYEAGRDASKFITKTAPIQMYLIDVDNVDCAQMVRPEGNDNIRLGYMLLSDGEIEINMPVLAGDYQLYDKQTGKAYNLTETITIYSEAGTYNGRLELRPVQHVATAIDNAIIGEGTTKLMLNGQLYLLRDGKMYTIQGVQVK